MAIYNDPDEYNELFGAYRASRPGTTAQAVQLERLNQIAAARTIPIYHRSPAEFESAMRALTPDQRAYVRDQLARGYPAPVRDPGPAGQMEQVFFPVVIHEPTAAELLADAQLRAMLAGQVNIVPNDSRVLSSINGTPAQPGEISAAQGAFYGDQWYPGNGNGED